MNICTYNASKIMVKTRFFGQYLYRGDIMKVILVTDDYTYPDREIRILNAVEFFSSQGDFEFIAFDIYKQKMGVSNLHILKVNSYDSIAKCISYVKHIIGDERFIVIYERYMRYIDLSALLKFHLSSDKGISVCKLGKTEREFTNCGIFVIENEYLDLIEEGYEPDTDLAIYSAERNDLGIFDTSSVNFVDTFPSR
jgi:hypothetical protein